MKKSYFLPLLTFPQPCSEAFLSRAISLARHRGAVLHAVVFDAPGPQEGHSRQPDFGDILEDESIARRHRAETLLRAATAQALSNGVELLTDWVDTDRNDASRLVAELAPGHDLALLESSRYNSTLYDASEALVFRSGIPCLVLPAGPFCGGFKHVVIAWDGSDSARRAIEAADVFIKVADLVSVLTISGEKKAPEDSVLGVVEMLQAKGSVAGAFVRSGDKDSGECLQVEALRIGGNLLVMGGFGHSRLKEYLFGGTTADVIRKTLMPVLIAH